MINNIQLLRNIGLFDSVSTGANIALARLTLAYAENGRGKTTLGAILRSLKTGDPLAIAERRRLSAQHPRVARPTQILTWVPRSTEGRAGPFVG